jgi:predicted peroxiredoxin
MAQEKYLFSITHLEQDPDRAAVPLVLANSALSCGADVLLWLTIEGARLGRQGAAQGLLPKSFPPVADLLAAFVEGGGRIGICPPCAKTHGVTDENKLPGATWLGAAALLAEAKDRQVYSF